MPQRTHKLHQSLIHCTDTIKRKTIFFGGVNPNSASVLAMSRDVACLVGQSGSKPGRPFFIMRPKKGDKNFKVTTSKQSKSNSKISKQRKSYDVVSPTEQSGPTPLKTESALEAAKEWDRPNNQLAFAPCHKESEKRALRRRNEALMHSGSIDPVFKPFIGEVDFDKYLSFFRHADVKFSKIISKTRSKRIISTKESFDYDKISIGNLFISFLSKRMKGDEIKEIFGELTLNLSSNLTDSCLKNLVSKCWMEELCFFDANPEVQLTSEFLKGKSFSEVFATFSRSPQLIWALVKNKTAFEDLEKQTIVWLQSANE